MTCQMVYYTEASEKSWKCDWMYHQPILVCHRLCLILQGSWINNADWSETPEVQTQVHNLKPGKIDLCGHDVVILSIQLHKENFKSGLKS